MIPAALFFNLLICSSVLSNLFWFPCRFVVLLLFHFSYSSGLFGSSVTKHITLFSLMLSIFLLISLSNFTIIILNYLSAKLFISTSLSSFLLFLIPSLETYCACIHTFVNFSLFIFIYYIGPLCFPSPG